MLHLIKSFHPLVSFAVYLRQAYWLKIDSDEMNFYLPLISIQQCVFEVKWLDTLHKSWNNCSRDRNSRLSWGFKMDNRPNEKLMKIWFYQSLHIIKVSEFEICIYFWLKKITIFENVISSSSMAESDLIMLK